jgi:hypothetical protein
MVWLVRGLFVKGLARLDLASERSAHPPVKQLQAEEECRARRVLAEPVRPARGGRAGAAGPGLRSPGIVSHPAGQALPGDRWHGDRAGGRTARGRRAVLESCLAQAMPSHEFQGPRRRRGVRCCGSLELK